MNIPSPAAGKWTAVLESAPRLCEIIAVENEPTAVHALIGRCEFYGFGAASSPMGDSPAIDSVFAVVCLGGNAISVVVSVW